MRVGLKTSAEDARWQLREVAGDACWNAREAAWTLEERVLWPGSEAARKALRRAAEAVRPLQRLIQPRLVWPLTDRLDDYGTGARTAVATLAVVAAGAAGIAGAELASPDAERAHLGGPAAAVSIPTTSATSTLS